MSRNAGGGEVGRVGKWDELQQWGRDCHRDSRIEETIGGAPHSEVRKSRKEKKRRQRGCFLNGGELERKVVEIPNGGVLQ